MPSPEEFAPRGGGVMTPERMQELKNRARQVRQAQANRTPIPGTGVGVVTAAEPAYEQPIQNQGRAVNGPVPVLTDDDELEQVRTRFKLANYYEALLEQPAFGDDIYTDVYAAQVQTELTDWVKGRMSELVGIRNNPEGFLDDEVQLLKALAQALGQDGVRALVYLAQRVTAAATQPPPRQEVAQPPPPPPPEEDEGSSAMSLSAPEPPPPPPPPAAPPQVTPVKAKAPRVRRARIPGAPAIAQAAAPEAPEAAAAPVQKRARKRSSDPLAAGKAMVAAKGQVETESAPAAAPAAPAAPPSNTPEPVPMPRGRNMEMVMAQKASEAETSALVHGRIIQATGGGVL